MLFSLNERTFQNILLQSPSGFCLLKGPDFIIEFANEPMLRAWKRDWNVIGKPILEALPELKEQKFPTLLQEVYTTGTAYHGYEEKAVLFEEGKPTVNYFTYVYQPFYNDEGVITGVTAMATDVTDQVVSRKQAAQSEERFKALVTATADVVYRMNPDWSEMTELLGRGFLSDTGQPNKDWLEKYILPKDQEGVIATIKKAVAHKDIFEMEHHVLMADGSLGWTFSRAVPILNDKDEIIEWFGAASDITSRKKAEEDLKAAIEQLESQKRLYETITSNTPDLIYVFDLNYNFTYANKALLTMWGKGWDDAIGKGLPENGYEDWHTEMHQREIDQVVATKQPIRGVVSFPHAELGKRVYDYIFVPVINEKGDVEAVAGTTRDITEIKLAEEALQKIREQLEELVSERTKELERSNEDLLQFAHVASHDLKEPVRKIRTFASRLRRDKATVLSPSADNDLTKIEKSSERIYKMIDGLLAYSSLDQVSVKELTSSVDLNEIAEKVESDLELLMQEKNAVIKYEKLPAVKGSSLLLHQVFYNLLYNSLKFSAEGVAPVINISGEPVKGTDKQKIVIEDNGIGFSQEHAEKIFQTFSRLNSKEKYEGTGLGLSLCRKIVERHGGTITAEGKEGAGAKFTILLPKADD